MLFEYFKMANVFVFTMIDFQVGVFNRSVPRGPDKYRDQLPRCFRFFQKSLQRTLVESCV